ncbi:MAG: hypothetical protein JXB20_04760 [Bacilli bacterium]|nr:hypothetical protein [Bacilli bacterium]MBN2696726.1 hypothetical protein [Bacilli bacterium]
MKKVLGFMLLTAFAFGFVACQGTTTTVPTTTQTTTTAAGTTTTGTTTNAGTTTQSSAGTTTTTTTATEPPVDLVINVAGENDKRLFTYLQANPLEMPDGTIIDSGDLKPLWQYIQNEVNIEIDDVATPGQKPADMFDLAAANQFEGADIFGGPNLGQKIMSAGVDGYFVDLSEHMAEMPNVSAYLAANPLVMSAITASDGGIYHLPYIAEINNYARMFLGRYSWVTALLDGEVNGSPFTLETETATLNVAYEAYWKTGTETLPYGGLRQTTNVVDLQNAAATGGVLDQATALQVLKDYIDATYPTLAKRSDLYLDETGQYDIDELVALWRVIKLSPLSLSKEAYGSAKPGTVIWPFYARQSNYREEVLRLILFFGGQRVHGSDSYGSRFYLDENGDLQYSYFQDDFLQNLNRIRAMFSEGLVDEKLSGAANTTNLRTGYIFKDTVETQLEYGFMCYDWTSSTTAASGGQDDVKAFLPPLTTTPVSEGEFIHYVENTRVVKPDGWGISANISDEALDGALRLFDYLFSVEGAKVQNYGTPDLWVPDQFYTNPTDGVQGPLFSTWTRDKATAVTNGDISSFLRDHIGAQIPIGYQKVIGFELQSTSANGMWSWQLYYGANDGDGVMMNSYSAENPYYQLVPPIFSLTSAENALLATTTTMTSDAQLIDRMMAFLGSKTGEGIPQTSEEVKAMFIAAGVGTYIYIYQLAFSRMSGDE